MLVGCFLGGLITGIGGGLKTSAFVFTSLLTIPAFNNIGLYALSIGVAFFTAMILVIISDYRTPEQKAQAAAIREAEATIHEAAVEAAAVQTPAVEAATAGGRPIKPAMRPGAITQIGSPLDGTVMPLEQIPDPVFSRGTVGAGVGILPIGDTVVSPAPGKILVAHETGHAFGIRLDSGIELLIHVGIDTVNMEGRGFDVKVKTGDRVEAGTPLVTFDRKVIEEEGYSLVTPVLVTNGKKFGPIAQAISGEVTIGTPVIIVNAKAPEPTDETAPATVGVAAE
ncbi:hypothetical protein SDC9_144039 [bioreactor metagenome]|uniref:PTS EIIA type-1 domain-containing protein n=1 Tax=bioreactor metagenome TaxID=1076179 RepID=A0A645E506_9ZZZZ